MKKTAFILMLACAMSLNFAFAQDHCKPMPDKNAPHPEKPQHQREPGSINPMMLKMKKDFIQENFVIESSKKVLDHDISPIKMSEECSNLLAKITK